MIAAYYEDSAVRLYHGDCLEVLPQLQSVDHSITDPPFDKEAHTQGRRLVRWQGPIRVAGFEALDFAPMDAATRTEAAREIARLSRRWVLTFCQSETAMHWRATYEPFGLTYRRTCFWVKPDGQPQLSGDRPGVGCEAIVAMHARGRSRWNGGGRVGIFSHVRANDGRMKNKHPTMKPVPLMTELVTLFTDEGDTILDPFAGSGTTGVAAKLNGRKAILIEREEKYCEVAAKRLAETQPGRLFEHVKAKPQSLLSAEGL